MADYYPQADAEDKAMPEGDETQETPDTPEAPETDGTDEESDGKEQKNGDSGESALLPKSILAGKKFDVGEEVVLKIVHDYGDEIEVEYATDKGGDDEDEASSPMKGAMNRLTALGGRGGY